jgi:hypothetical protein
MDTGKLNKIIDDRNEKLEREALREAESIIEAISILQAAQISNDERIANLRAKLVALNIPQLDKKTILGV